MAASCGAKAEAIWRTHGSELFASAIEENCTTSGVPIAALSSSEESSERSRVCPHERSLSPSWPHAALRAGTAAMSRQPTALRKSYCSNGSSKPGPQHQSGCVKGPAFDHQYIASV